MDQRFQPMRGDVKGYVIDDVLIPPGGLEPLRAENVIDRLFDLQKLNGAIRLPYSSPQRIQGI